MTYLNPQDGCSGHFVEVGHLQVEWCKVHNQQGRACQLAYENAALTERVKELETRPDISIGQFREMEDRLRINRELVAEKEARIAAPSPVQAEDPKPRGCRKDGFHLSPDSFDGVCCEECAPRGPQEGR